MSKANTYNSVTKLWTAETAGALQTSETTAVVTQVIFAPTTARDDLVIQDGRGNTAIVLKAGATDSSCVRWPAEEGGRMFDGLTIATIDGGVAYIYLYKK